MGWWGPMGWWEQGAMGWHMQLWGGMWSYGYGLEGNYWLVGGYGLELSYGMVGGYGSAGSYGWLER